MFLKDLNEEERVIFLNMANIAIMVDDEATIIEEKLLRRQIEECEVENFFPKMFNLDQLLDKLTDSSLKVKKIIYLELIAICLADDRWHAKEEEMMTKIADSFGLSDEVSESIKKWAIDFRSHMETGFKLIS